MTKFTIKISHSLHTIAKSRLLVTSIFICISLLVLYIRKSDLFHNPQLYAEDGVILFTESYNKGWRSILMPYAGYYITYQRIIACASLASPIAYVPHCYAIGLIISLIFIIYYLFTDRVTLPHKPLLALAITLSPFQNEVFFGLANSQWILALGLLLLLFSKQPESIKSYIFEVMLFIVIGLTGPFSILFLPLYVICALWKRTRWNYLLLLLCAILATIQCYNIDNIDRALGNLNGPYAYIRVAAYYFTHMFIGHYSVIDFNAKFLNVALFLISVVTYLALIVYGVKVRSLPIIIFTLSSVIIIFATIYSFKNSPHILIGDAHRYTFIPTISFAWALICLIPYKKMIASILLSLMLANTIIFHAHYIGPHFKDYEWRKWSACIGKSKYCVIPHPPETWQITITSKK